MSKSLLIDADWERLESGPPEERYTFAAIGIYSHGLCLTEAEDLFVKAVRQKVPLSAYHLAEWLAWNWWRLRWEPRKNSTGWAMAHHMPTIGGGYVWPNITITSDGERVVFHTKPTQPRGAEPLRYIADVHPVVRARDFDEAVDAFTEQVRGRLDLNKIRDTNLHAIWDDLLSDRADPNATLFRKFEALLGKDPGEADPEIVNGLIEDAAKLGKSAMAEIAANEVVTAAELTKFAQTAGVDSGDVVRLEPGRKKRLPTGVAWQRGAEAARALRLQEHLDTPISNEHLCAMAGVPRNTLTAAHKPSPLSFVLDEGKKSRLVLRSKFLTGRRFAMARLIGDRALQNGDDRLFPATDAFTYRQKQQRAFAAELLCPFEPLADRLKGDFSPEAIEEAADHFKVSERTVLTLLVNHNLLDREALDPEDELAA